MEFRIRDNFSINLTDETLTALKESGMTERLFLHGLRQKLADAFAGKTPTAGAEAAARVWSNLLAGNWGAERGETGLGIARGLLLKARTRLKNPPKAAAWAEDVRACGSVEACAAFAEKRLGKGMGERLAKKVASLLAEQRSGF